MKPPVMNIEANRRRRLVKLSTLTLALAVGLSVHVTASAQPAAEDIDAPAEAREIPVTIDNFARAASDIEFDKYVKLAGGINKFYHFREPTPVDNQPTIRMNRDTLYSTAIVDISEGATLTLPDVGDRYMSAMIVNQDHFINEVFYGGGTYTLDMETFDTPYVIVYMRTLVDADDPNDVAAVNAIQDQMKIEAVSSNPFNLPDYDKEAYETLVDLTNQLLPFSTNKVTGVFGRKEDVDPVRHLIGTGIGWAGLPHNHAYYPANVPNLPVGEYKIEVPPEVPVGAFWSVTVYNADGYMEPNDLGRNNYNNVSAEPNDDGSITIHLGACDDGRVNCIPITPGWSYAVRLYQPRAEILDGSWSFPLSNRRTEPQGALPHETFHTFPGAGRLPDLAGRRVGTIRRDARPHG